jgi:hypothetical protein
MIAATSSRASDLQPTDGRTAKGAVAADGSRVQLFSIVDQDSGVPLGQVEIEAGDESVRLLSGRSETAVRRSSLRRR